MSLLAFILYLHHHHHHHLTNITDNSSTARPSVAYHLHVALQFADPGPLALGGAHVAKVMDGDGGTDTGVHLSH